MLSLENAHLDEDWHVLIVLHELLQELLVSRLRAVEDNCVVLLLEEPVARERLAHLYIGVGHDLRSEDEPISFIALVLRLRN